MAGNRVSYNCALINEPRTIAGIDWSIFFAVAFFFTMAIIETHVYWIAVIPLTFVWLLRGPCRRDPKLLEVYRRHRAQQSVYVPWVGQIDVLGKSARPIGFSRFEQIF